MKTNPKKPITVKNNTHYFEPAKSKATNTFINPRTYYAKKNKIEGYENRLYWEWKKTKDKGGETYFYTLTYNDANIPKYQGENCFDYEDLRQLLNGAFTKKILRNYGTKIKYFVGAELGEGKGKRGNKNNPHYHILFFLTDAENEKYQYKKIDPYEFRNLLRIYWQGIDQEREGYTDYRKFKKGIVKEGENIGLVTDYRAVAYCAKYVTKDIGLIKREAKIEEEIRKKWNKKIYCCTESYQRYWDEEIMKKYNIPKYCSLEENKEYQWSGKQLADQMGTVELGNIKWKDNIDICQDIIDKFNLNEDFNKKCKQYLDEKVHEIITEYRNRYCNKCRISHGVGDYAIENINTENPKIGIYTKTGYKERNINLYYYRKIYCDIVKDPVGNNKYILNEKGKQLKIKQLEEKIEKLQQETLSNLSWLDEQKLNDIIASNINTQSIATWDDIKALKNNEEKREITKRYAEYKLVYEGRFYKVQNMGLPHINIMADYTSFIEPEYNTTKYNMVTIDDFMQNNSEGYLAYNTHPYFLQDMYFYNLFDTIADYMFVQEDNRKEKEDNTRKEIRRYHKTLQYNQYLKTI